MSATWLALLVTLAAIPPVHAIACVAIGPWRHTSGPRERAATHADTVFLRSIAPAALAFCAAVFVVLPAFVLFEASGHAERPGVLMALSAAVGAAYVVTAFVRLLSALYLSRLCTSAWMRNACTLPITDWGLPAFAIDVNYPVVAVAGVIRPRLFIDRRVLECCSAEELQAIGAHERAHVDNYDNARRLLMSACVGSRSLSAQQWRAAAEVAADERAASSPEHATVLAGALIKIARLATMPAPRLIQFSTIHDGGSLETRVHRLLSMNATPARNGRREPLIAGIVVLSITIAAQGTPLLAAVHSLIELFVRAQ
ncbi:MAG TPA: M48 family metalloprotease [Vicinamibacterales bacterium]|nr:M48 family metalloprotease [Vicinamibacterales bacterium]